MNFYIEPHTVEKFFLKYNFNLSILIIELEKNRFLGFLDELKSVSFCKLPDEPEIHLYFSENVNVTIRMRLIEIEQERIYEKIIDIIKQYRKFTTSEMGLIDAIKQDKLNMED